MFSGIIQTQGEIKRINEIPMLRTFTIDIPNRYLKNIQKGASVSIDGVCLTVVNINDNELSFDAMNETLSITTLGNLQKGDKVNIERSIKADSEIGGHRVSGHVSGMAQIFSIEEPENNYIITFKIDKKWMKYILPKGFIAINGASLTIVNVDHQNNSFTVHLIPETLKITTFAQKKVGQFVNIEIDPQTQAIVDTVERVLENRT